MSQWWTYRLSDFLMFSPRTYWRLVELYNREVWPVHAVALGLGIALLLAAASGRPSGARGVAAGLAAAWLWVGWAFHWQRYATINWAASGFAVAFWIEAGLLLLAAGAHGGVRQGSATMRAAGWASAVGGVILYPLAAPAAGRPWAQSEVFGLMPEPTALATVGLLLVLRQPRTSWLLVVPVVSLLVGAATLRLLSV